MRNAHALSLHFQFYLTHLWTNFQSRWVAEILQKYQLEEKEYQISWVAFAIYVLLRKTNFGESIDPVHISVFSRLQQQYFPFQAN